MENEGKGLNYNSLEISKIIGEPLDPRKKYPDVVSAICQLDTAQPDDYVYYFDVLLETDVVHTITSTGLLTTVEVSPDTPVEFTFIDIASPEYYVKVTDLAKSKEATLARKLLTIDRALNMEESRYILALLDAGAVSAGNTHNFSSGNYSFTYFDLIEMIDDVIDYADGYTLVCGSLVDKDIKLWDWTANKYASMIAAFNDLAIEKIRVTGSFTLDGVASTNLIANTTAYLVGRNTTVGKPMLFVRKNLNDIDLLGAAIKQNGEKPQRLIFASPNPITIESSGAKRYLAVGLTGYEEIVAAVVNQYALSKFVRS